MMRQRGFTLIEVLVAVVVLGIGLTGVAGLQLISLRSGQQAFQRTQATFIAYDMVDRMRANLPGSRAGDYDTALADDVSALPLCFGVGANCNTSEMADHDRRSWRQSLLVSLPAGTGSVATALVAGQTQATIMVQWVDTDAVDDAGIVTPQQLSIVVSL